MIHIQLLTDWTLVSLDGEPTYVPAVAADYPRQLVSVPDVGWPGDPTAGPTTLEFLCNADTFAALQADPRYAASVQVIEY